MVRLAGREPELAAIDEVLQRATSGLTVLRIEGEPGIGKSELLRSAVSRAMMSGFGVLESQPGATEARLAFSSLSDLLVPIVDASIDRLPDPQRVAIEVALLRRSPGGRRIAPRAVSAGALSLLKWTAEHGPLLVAVDDVQWLDAASAAAMTYAFRRLTTAPVAILLAGREPEGEVVSLADIDSLGSDRVSRLRVGPLSLSATYHVLRQRDLAPMSRPALRRIHEVAGGNPLFAIELARAARDRGDSPDAREPLPVSDSVRTLFGRRIASHGHDARTAMLIVGLGGSSSERVVRSVDPRAAGRVDELVAGGILVRQDGYLRFAHPLLAEVAVASFEDSDRRTMHRRLAELVDEPERRARHRALGAEAPDSSVAAELEAAAAGVAGTSPEAACELLELAIGATPESERERRQERLLALARESARAGDTRGARSTLDALIVSCEVGVTRARALELRAQIDWVDGRADHGIERCEEALQYPDLDPWTRARLAVTRTRLTTDPDDAQDRAKAALEVLDRLPNPDPALRVEALTALADAQNHLGASIDPALVEEALALEAVAPPSAVSDRFSAALGALLKYQGKLDEARVWLRRTLETAIAEGDEGSLPYALSHLPQLELWTGDWTAAEEAAREHLTVAEWTGQEEQRLTAIYSLALVEAHTGRLDDARRRISAALPAAEILDEWNVYQLLSTLGFVELSAGDPHAALPPLRRAYEIYERLTGGDTHAVHENFAEALVGSGDLAAAETMIGPYVDRATRLNRPMGLAASYRGLGMLRAAQGRMDEALVALDSALLHEENAAAPFSRGRTLLVSGRTRRRAGARKAARAALDEAFEIFSNLGAPLWAANAGKELDRLPGRRRVGPHELTPTERRIADLVGQGLTNSEVARQLFVSPKTVEANLTRIYTKLAVRSRTELAAMLRDMGQPGSEM